MRDIHFYLHLRVCPHAISLMAIRGALQQQPKNEQKSI
jgi:hypothetical protein